MQFTFHAIPELKTIQMTASVIFVSLVVALIGNSESSANSKNIELASFAIGQCIKAHYTAPTTGRVTVQLSATDGTIVLTLDYRKNWGGNPNTGQPWQNIVILNSNIGGAWGTEQHVEDVLTTPGMEMALKICAKEEDFSIVLNQDEIATYTYRTPVTTVSKVEYTNRGYDSILRKLCVVYSQPGQ